MTIPTAAPPSTPPNHEGTQPGAGTRPRSDSAHPGSTDTAAVNDQRRLRRRRLLRWSVGPAAVALLIAGKLLGTPILNATAVSAYEAGVADPMEYERSQRLFTLAGFANLFEREVSPFNQGDVLFRLGDLPGAQAQFERALGLAGPDRACQVRVNLVLSIEAQGDALGDVPGAQAHYDAALAVIDEAEYCFSEQAGSEASEAGDRLMEAQERIEENSDPEPGEGDDGDEGEDGETEGEPESAPDQSTLEQLEEQQAGAAQERAEGEQNQESRDYEPAEYDDARW
ncbi:hypothetical protein OCAE111667_17905 [Occultella aeris]|uniref:Tetratricopeptide repeat protein n=1 Tax=Occultella aeris TaxID=2761496 RepID=A0A7M4DHT7_9MICO|nr:hypothetical protein [Occultella aeris]VZO36480.1 hypothetical protein HALOF300_01688 [Occultella aeris]